MKLRTPMSILKASFSNLKKNCCQIVSTDFSYDTNVYFDDFLEIKNDDFIRADFMRFFSADKTYDKKDDSKLAFSFSFNYLKIKNEEHYLCFVSIQKDEVISTSKQYFVYEMRDKLKQLNKALASSPSFKNDINAVVAKIEDVFDFVQNKNEVFDFENIIKEKDKSLIDAILLSSENLKINEENLLIAEKHIDDQKLNSIEAAEVKRLEEELRIARIKLSKSVELEKEKLHLTTLQKDLEKSKFTLEAFKDQLYNEILKLNLNYRFTEKELEKVFDNVLKNNQ